jgi:hypothetical protein
MYEQKRREVNKAFEKYEKQLKAAKAKGQSNKQSQEKVGAGGEGALWGRPRPRGRGTSRARTRLGRGGEGRTQRDCWPSLRAHASMRAPAAGRSSCHPLVAPRCRRLQVNRAQAQKAKGKSKRDGMGGEEPGAAQSQPQKCAGGSLRAAREGALAACAGARQPGRAAGPRFSPP